MAGQKAFDAQISDWVKQTQQRIDAVFRESAQRVIEDMQTPVGAGGNMPVDTGFLRASLQVSTQLPTPRGGAPEEGKTYAYDAGPVALVIAGAHIGQTIYAVFGAAYSSAVEYGSRGREGRHFVGLAAQRWPMTVTAVCRDLQSSVEGRTPGT
jgi:hypothetical protein